MLLIRIRTYLAESFKLNKLSVVVCKAYTSVLRYLQLNGNSSLALKKNVARNGTLLTLDARMNINKYESHSHFYYTGYGILQSEFSNACYHTNCTS